MKRTYSFILSLFVVAMTTISCSNDDDTIPQSSLAEITNFTLDFTGLEADAVAYDLGTAISVSVPYGTSLTGVIPAITISENASISPASGDAISFEDGVAKTFTVTAEDGAAKQYTVTVNIRPEVGSGSKIKTYSKTLDLSGFVLEDTWTYEYDDDSGFVNKLSVSEAFLNTVTYTLVYDDKNQVIEKTAEGQRTVYTYEDGKIMKAEEFEDQELKYTFEYTYNENDLMVREERTNHQGDEPVLDDLQTYLYDANGNVIKYNNGTAQINPVEATYDTKNNPFKSIYPKAYAAISVSGIDGVNTNNPITRDETEVSYAYNSDDYPLESSYSTPEADITNTFTYYAE
ncbi:hypothetical protein [Leeuwenhoekiella marinoflava]|uniref:YD repeat-containing protein n=2 Tax=Leeuwenhoekiella marinoflava TaxID=988 RepID=A0A4Q0PPC6_9FLAO|nr:hypothetical protein [Leeuwenhoekiella marinoflava]RXG32410.1 hypothetical protein DSL99_732 [Leeuwenhoekiella marinoflava]SHE72653.1 hypothetical protein SAMN02745246_00943 [Leeuwenhoekiella marinoflava DSM 3653]